MAYISADEVKAIRNELKAQFPKFKFGVRKGSGSLSVDVTIKSGPIDFIENYLDHKQITNIEGANWIREKRHIQVNQFWLDSHYSGEALSTLEKIMEIIKTAPNDKWYDRSDAMTDYFDTAYYIHLSVGEWNAPYALVK